MGSCATDNATVERSSFDTLRMSDVADSKMSDVSDSLVVSLSNHEPGYLRYIAPHARYCLTASRGYAMRTLVTLPAASICAVSSGLMPAQ